LWHKNGEFDKWFVYWSYLVVLVNL
jgi:hypothetical protein